MEKLCRVVRLKPKKTGFVIEENPYWGILCGKQIVWKEPTKPQAEKVARAFNTNIVL